MKDAAGIDEHTRHKAEFYVKQIANAIAPTNFVLTNPELLRETLSSNAENLVRGMHMLGEDIKAGHGHLKIRQSDPATYEVGRNLALTPGKVVFQNELMQLIQYEATTRRSAQGSVADRAALDQQILHSRSHAGEILHQVVRRQRGNRVRGLLGQSRRQARRKKLRAIHARRRDHRARQGRGGDRRTQDQCHRLLRRRHAAVDHTRLSRGQERRPRAVGDLFRGAGRFHLCRRSLGVRRRGAHQAARSAHEGTGLSRSLAHGHGLQPAALQRPGLALLRQQLSARQEAVLRSIFCTGIPTPPACRRPITRSICATSISTTN